MITDFENKLTQKGIAPTAMRLLVIEKLSQQKAAISHKELTALFEKADATTLFRTLKTFLEHKLIHTIEDGTGHIKYALCTEGCTCSPADLHSHFHCTICQKTFCLLNAKPSPINLPQNFTLQSINLVLKGVCDACS